MTKRLTMWKVSAAWSSKAHDCTLTGILARCGGACCYSVPPRKYWPSSAANRPDHACHYMGAQGCTLTPADKPITCLLYPLRLNKNGSLVLHHRTMYATSCCAGNHGQGPPLIEAMEDSLVGLFGRPQYERVKAQILAGEDSFFTVTPAILAALADEEVWERDNVIPLLRSRARP